MAAGVGIERALQIRPRCSRMRRPKPSRLASCARLGAAVEQRLELRWSPQQISGWLVDEFPDDPEMRVSHETIYVSLLCSPAARYARN